MSRLNKMSSIYNIMEIIRKMHKVKNRILVRRCALSYNQTLAHRATLYYYYLVKKIKIYTKVINDGLVTPDVVEIMYDVLDNAEQYLESLMQKSISGIMNHPIIPGDLIDNPYIEYVSSPFYQSNIDWMEL